MKRIIYTILALAAIAFTGISCDGDSYQKRIDKEKKAIKNFLADNDIQIINKFPGADYVYKDNEYYYDDSTGIYMRVIYPGVLTDVIDKDKRTEVSVRVDSVDYLVSNLAAAGNNGQNHNAIIFTYGDASTYTSSNVYGPEYTYMSPALILPLKLGLGRNAQVSMIVPLSMGLLIRLINTKHSFSVRLVTTFSNK